MAQSPFQPRKPTSFFLQPPLQAINQTVLTTITSAAGGATSGTANTASSLSFALVAGSNITLSQLSSSPNITVIGGAGGGGATFTLNGSTGSASLVAGAGISLAANASTITISNSAPQFSLNGSSSSLSISAGANIGISQGASTITISASNQSVRSAITSAAGGATSGTVNTASSTAWALVAGSNITLSQLSTSPNITISANVPAATNFSLNGSSSSVSLVAGLGVGFSSNNSTITVYETGTLSYTALSPLNAVGLILSSSSTTSVSSVGFGSSLFLQRIYIPNVMNLSEVDLPIALGYAGNSSGAGTISQSFILYSFGNSSSLASVLSAGGSTTWNSGTSTVGGSTSITQYQRAWSGTLLRPLTFASTSVAPGEYVAGMLLNFGFATSSWSVSLFGGNAQTLSTASFSAATAVTSATLSGASSFATDTVNATAFTATPTVASVFSTGGLLTGSALTGISSYPSQFIAVSTAGGQTSAILSGASTSTSSASVAGLTQFVSNTATSLRFAIGFVSSNSNILSSLGTITASQITATALANAISNAGTAGFSVLSGLTSASIAAVTAVGLAALGSTTVSFATSTLLNFSMQYIGTSVAVPVNVYPDVFVCGILSTGATTSTIAITSSAMISTGSAALIQPWFAMVGA